MLFSLSFSGKGVGDEGHGRATLWLTLEMKTKKMNKAKKVKKKFYNAKKMKKDDDDGRKHRLVSCDAWVEQSSSRCTQSDPSIRKIENLEGLLEQYKTESSVSFQFC